MKNNKKYFLTGGLLLSTLILSLAGIFQSNYILPDFSDEEASVEAYLPFVTFLENIHTHDISFVSPFDRGNDCPEEEDDLCDISPQGTQEMPLVTTPHITISDSKTYKETLVAKAAFLEKIGVKNACDFINQGIPAYQNMTAVTLADLGATPKDVSYFQNAYHPPKTYPFTRVDDSYFEDAVFIGDSRTVGIENYAGIDNATFLCKTSLTIFDYDKKKITYEGQKTSIKDVLSHKQFKKIYLMVGINECGFTTTEKYFESYAAVVSDIRSLQPDALIFIEGNLSMTQKKSDESPKLNNPNLFFRNAAIKTLANQTNIFYIDINESTLCKDGVLIPDYTWDQIHIKAEYYPIWKDFLLTHGIVIS